MSFENTLTHTARSLEPRQARTSSRTSGEGRATRTPRSRANQRPVTVKKPETLAAKLIRHNLVAPEKRTVKRIDALRRECFGGGVVDVDSLGSRLFDHLRSDRGLQSALDMDHCASLAAKLLDSARATQTAATIIGDYLRAVGGIQRSRVTPERVKSALAVASDALYDLDNPGAPIPANVRDIKVERRDGGLQLVAFLRHGADEAAAVAGLTVELQRAGYGDIDVRAEAPDYQPRPVI